MRTCAGAGRNEERPSSLCNRGTKLSTLPTSFLPHVLRVIKVQNGAVGQEKEFYFRFLLLSNSKLKQKPPSTWAQKVQNTGR